MIEFVGALPADLSAAIFVVLHVPPETPSQLASVLGRASKLPARAAVDQEEVLPGHIYVATADHHLMIDGNRIRITRGPREGRVRPSIDVLFRSAAVSCGPHAIAVVLSGALDDGTAGAWAIKDQGGLVLVQLPSEAMHASMPESVIQHVAVDHVATARGLGEVVAGLVGSPVETATAAGNQESRNVETLIAMEGNGLKAGVMELGKVSKYTCPDCHGVLVEIEEGTIVRFRCHTGHAFSLLTLLAEVNESVDKGLWVALRAIEERVMLLRHMEQLARALQHRAEAERCKLQAEDTEKRLQPLRELLLDPKFFGHDQES